MYIVTYVCSKCKNAPLVTKVNGCLYYTKPNKKGLIMYIEGDKKEMKLGLIFNVTFNGL
jgi:hypothetical protein